MARTKRDFQESEEIFGIAERLKSRYSEMLKYVNLGDIYFALCMSKKADNAKAVIRKGISDPLPQAVTRRRYQIAFYASDWADWSDAQKHAMVFEALFSIDEDGKYKRYDVQGFFPIIKTWGPDWMEDPNLPDLLEKQVHFQTKPEEPKKDEGQSAGPKVPKGDPVLAAIVEDEESKRKALAQREEMLKQKRENEPQEDKDEEPTF